MSRRHLTEARDTGGRGISLNHLLLDFNLARNLTEANNLVRTGAVDVDNRKIKDILHLVVPGTYDIKLHGDYVLRATVL